MSQSIQIMFAMPEWWTKSGSGTSSYTANFTTLPPNQICRPTSIHYEYYLKRSWYLAGGTATGTFTYNGYSNSQSVTNDSELWGSADIAISYYSPTVTQIGASIYNQRKYDTTYGILFYAYFTQYDFTATAGSNIATASVSSSTGYDGDTITYSCVLADGSTFDGWYNGSTRVSTSQTYTHTVNGADVSLTAVGTAPTTKTMSATYNGTQLSGFPINVSGNTDIAYNGTTIATVPFSGGTKTLNCSGKLMNGNVTAGGKTLNCSGKVMSGDVVFTIS